MEGKYLITTDAWFIAPNGNHYKSAWGEIEILGDNILGIKTNARATNWYAKVGSKDNHIIIAGCQIHYAIKCNDKPQVGNVLDYSTEQGNFKEYNRPSSIYIAE